MWQTIETAPESAATEPLWVWVPEWQMQAMGWARGGQWWGPASKHGRMRIPPPSHWMPLPDPPVITGNSGCSARRRLDKLADS